MAKNKKPAAKAMPAAPKADAEKVIEPEVINDKQKPVQVLDLNEFMEKVGKTTQEGLDPNHRVELLKMMHETWRMDPEAAKKYKVSQDTVDEINRITAVGQVAALACEATFGKNPFAISMSTSQLLAIAEVGKDMGINLNVKALPAPDKDGNVTVQSTDLSLTKEAKETLKAEEAVAAKPSVDPTQIENDEQLKEAIAKIMIERPNGYQKISESINFYRAYLGVKASKAKNREAELKKVNEKTDIVLLQEIRSLLGKCPFVLNGMGRTMATFTAASKSPIPAFCMFRNTTKSKQTGIPALSDKEVADYVRILVEWATTLKIEEYQSNIEKHKENIKALSADKKGNAKGIEDCNAKIEACKNSIEHLKEVVTIVSVPTSEVVDDLLKEYAENEKTARSIFKHITDSFYADVDLKAIEPAVLKHNVQQYAGIITNLFRDSTTPLMAYSEANILDLDTKVVHEEPEKTEEEPKKELRRVK